MQQRVDMMYVHALDPLKGWFQLSALDKSAAFDPSILSNGVTIYPGRCVFCNDSGYFTSDRYSTASTIGGKVTNTTTAMPMFLWAGTNDADVYNDGTALTQTIAGSAVSNWTAIMPAGISMALVATGGYELQTTEFVASPTCGNAYIPNAALAVVNSSWSGSDQGASTTVNGITYYPNVGLLTTSGYSGAAAAQSTDLLVGICSPFTQGQVNYLQPTNQVNPGAGVSTNTSTGYNAHGMAVLSFWTYFLPAGASAGGR